MVAALELAGPFHRHEIGHALDHAQGALVAPGVLAKRAQLCFRQGEAARAKPNLSHQLLDCPSQVASEALEFALHELESRLPPALPPDDEALSLDAVMAFLCRPTPRT